MARDKELEKLRREVEERREKAQRFKKRSDKVIENEILKRKLRRELFILKNPKKVLFALRAKRGFLKTGKIVGKAAIAQGRLIKAQQERDDRLMRARSQIKPKVKIRKTKKRIQRNGGGFNLLAPLDF